MVTSRDTEQLSCPWHQRGLIVLHLKKIVRSSFPTTFFTILSSQGTASAATTAPFKLRISSDRETLQIMAGKRHRKPGAVPRL